MNSICYFFFFSSRRRHTRLQGDWSSDVCSSDLCADTQVVELGALGAQTRFDVAQALAIRQLRKRHTAKLIRATEMTHAPIATVTLDDTPKALPRQMLHELREHQFADVHVRPLCSPKPQIRANCRSNRRHRKNALLPQTIRKLQTSYVTLTGQY